MILNNESNRIVYYNAYSNRIIDEDKALKQALSSKSEDYYNFLSNGLNTLRSPGSYKYFNGLAALPPQTRIKVDIEHYHILENIPKYKISPEFGLIHLKNEVKTLLKKYTGKKIGVELSGGLDSSLVIEALLALKIDPILIGFCSDSFEFRTERTIQNYYQNKVSESILLKYEDNFAFDNLKETPAHPIPVCESHFFQRHKTVALTAKNMGVDILFSGEAGDQI
jgi:asparagine synthetase B (glutamine-hydrolysing)